MRLFLLSWAGTFVTLFVAFFWIRARLPPSTSAALPKFPLTLPLIDTGVALLGSLAGHLTLRDLRRGNRRAAGVFLLATLLSGGLFLSLQLLYWAHAWRQGFRILGPGRADTAAFAGCFYALTGFHALHVVAALVVLGWMAPGVLRGRYSASRQHPVRLAMGFWHFVTGVWLAVLLALVVA